MKIYPYQTPNGVIELVEKREYDKLCKELNSVTDGEIITNVRLFDLVRYARASLHADELITNSEYAWLCSYNPGEPVKTGSPSRLRLESYDELRAANAELIERLAEARESHIAASARDVQTIQRQAIMLEKFAKALEFYALGNHIGTETSDGSGDSWVSGGEDGKLASSALSAYKSANLDLVNPIDEAVKRMEAIDTLPSVRVFTTMGQKIGEAMNDFRARLIQAAKGES